MELITDIYRIITETIGLEPDSIGKTSIDHIIKKRILSTSSKSIQDYLELLNESNDEIENLIEELVVPETWFFRDKEPYVLLKNHITEIRNNRSKKSKIKILSIPCSSGEEPYSIAITLFEMGLTTDKFSIDAIDISSQSITKAMKGVYKKISFRDNSSDLIEKYFDISEYDYKLNSKILHSVNFHRLNLVSEEINFPSSSYDIIFCKNLIIYLNEKSRKSIINNIKNLILPDGLVFVGHTELTYFLQNGFTSINHTGAFACKKKIIEKSSHSPKIKQIETLKNNFQKTHQPIFLDKPIRPGKIESFEKNQNVTLEINVKEQIRIYANKGDLNSALNLCEDSIQYTKSDDELYLLAGLINETKGSLLEAEQYYQKSIYLNPNNYDALIHLSLLYESQGNIEKSNLYKDRASRAHISSEIKLQSTL